MTTYDRINYYIECQKELVHQNKLQANQLEVLLKLLNNNK